MRKFMRPIRFEEEIEDAAQPPLPPNASVAKRWKFRRNLVIYIAHREGISQRVLAEVFDLPRSRIASIIKQMDRFQPVVKEGQWPGFSRNT